MRMYQRKLRIWWTDPYEKVYVTDWLPEDEALELYHSCKSDEKEPDDYGQGYYESYWRFYSYDEKFEELEQEPCNDDCISRAEATKALNCKINGSIESNIDLSKYKREFQEFADMIIKAQEKAIQALPPVRPKSEKGHWIEGENGPYCDNCGNGVGICYKFCPFCGRDMREYV